VTCLIVLDGNGQALATPITKVEGRFTLARWLGRIALLFHITNDGLTAVINVNMSDAHKLLTVSA
jgi:hypothetical protein